MDEKKRKRLERAERAAEEVRNDELGRRLQARIDYHEANLEEERKLASMRLSADGASGASDARARAT